MMIKTKSSLSFAIKATKESIKIMRDIEIAYFAFNRSEDIKRIQKQKNKLHSLLLDLEYQEKK